MLHAHYLSQVIVASHYLNAIAISVSLIDIGRVPKGRDNKIFIRGPILFNRLLAFIVATIGWYYC